MNSFDERFKIDDLRATYDELQKMEEDIRNRRIQAGKDWIKAREEVFRNLTDEEILGDEEIKQALCRTQGSDYIFRLYKGLVNIPVNGIDVGYVDGREGFWGLPAPEVRLNYQQDVSEIARAFHDWIKIWGMGRPNITINVLEHTLSSYGSWAIEWDFPNDKAVVVCMRWHRRYEEHQGTLESALEYIAEHAWYEGGEEDDDDD